MISPKIIIDSFEILLLPSIITFLIISAWEIIDKKTAFVEFYDQKGEFIEIDNELAFKVELKNIRLKK